MRAGTRTEADVDALLADVARLTTEDGRWDTSKSKGG